jgi:ketosteroid isomerase-like protein
MRRPFIVVLLALALPVLALGQTPAAGQSAAEKAVRETDAANAKSAAAKSVEGVLSYYDEEAVLADSNGATFRGQEPEAFRAVWEKMFAQSGALTWTIQRLVVLKSGTTAYSSGTWTNGIAKGTFVAVWRKHPDGKWKVLTTTTWTAPPSGQ